MLHNFYTQRKKFTIFQKEKQPDGAEELAEFSHGDCLMSSLRARFSRKKTPIAGDGALDVPSRHMELIALRKDLFM